jgi:hypothetical protein
METRLLVPELLNAKNIHKYASANCKSTFETRSGHYWDIFGDFWVTFGTLLGLFLSTLGTLFGHLWDSFETLLGYFRYIFGTLVGHFWDTCCIRLGHFLNKF